MPPRRAPVYRKGSLRTISADRLYAGILPTDLCDCGARASDHIMRVNLTKPNTTKVDIPGNCCTGFRNAWSHISYNNDNERG
jgi:hypothetical protein